MNWDALLRKVTISGGERCRPDRIDLLSSAR